MTATQWVTVIGLAIFFGGCLFWLMRAGMSRRRYLKWRVPPQGAHHETRKPV